MAVPWFLTRTMFQVYKLAPIPLVAVIIGRYADHRDDLKMSDYHNKSKLFGGKELAPGERVW